MTIQVEWNQSLSRPVSSMICSAPTKTMSNARPTTSIRVLAVGVSNLVTSCVTENTQRATTGRFMKKIHGHVQLSLIQPPRMGPRIGAAVVVTAQMPSAAA